MIGLTRRCQYALRALYFLAREYGNGPILRNRISVHANAPMDFLEAILLDLKTAGIVVSKQGRNGGYMLATPPDTVTIESIIRSVDGPLITLPCLNGNGHRCEVCNDAHICQTQLFMRDVQQSVAQVLNKITLLSLSRMTEATPVRPSIM